MQFIERNDSTIKRNKIQKVYEYKVHSNLRPANCLFSQHSKELSPNTERIVFVYSILTCRRKRVYSESRKTLEFEYPLGCKWRQLLTFFRFGVASRSLHFSDGEMLYRVDKRNKFEYIQRFLFLYYISGSGYFRRFEAVMQNGNDHFILEYFFIELLID